MTQMFGPKRCALCGADHYSHTACPIPARTDIATRVVVAGPRRMFVAQPSGQFISDEAESAFVVWEQRNSWVWKDLDQRRTALNAFSAGWIACEEARPASSAGDQ